MVHNPPRWMLRRGWCQDGRHRNLKQEPDTLRSSTGFVCPYQRKGRSADLSQFAPHTNVTRKRSPVRGSRPLSDKFPLAQNRLPSFLLIVSLKTCAGCVMGIPVCLSQVGVLTHISKLVSEDEIGKFVISYVFLCLAACFTPQRSRRTTVQCSQTQMSLGFIYESVVSFGDRSLSNRVRDIREAWLEYIYLPKLV